MKQSTVQRKRECAFCGTKSKPLTIEHVFPDWIGKLFSKRVEVRNILEGPTKKNQWSSRAFQLTAKVVCKDCNEGWMSNLEGQIKPILKNLAFSRAQSSIDSETQKLLATWALKTILVYSKTGESHALISPAFFERMFKERAPDPRVLVSIGRRDIRAPGKSVPKSVSFGGFELHQVESVQVRKELESTMEKKQPIIWSGTIHLGMVIFKLIGQEGLSLQVGSDQAGVLVPLGSSGSSDITWPISRHVDEVGGLRAIQKA